MTTNDDKTLLVLNDLLLAARDARRGFATAQGCATDPELVRLFDEYARQRKKFAEELEARIRTLRSEPVKLPNPAAAVHRAWMETESEAASNPSHALLAECERGEDMAVKTYAAALKEVDMDQQSRALIQAQYELVQATHDRIRQLRDGAKYAHR